MESVAATPTAEMLTPRSNEVDPISYLSIPCHYIIVFDTKQYDARVLASCVANGFNFVPHSRRPFTTDEIERVHRVAGLIAPGAPRKAPRPPSIFN
jgi:hypothetical protein